MSFDGFRLNHRIEAGIRALGYATPTPIQRRAIGPALEGRDLIGLAQTGTGKTAAFVLPLLQRLMTGPRRRVRALILAPTRELAEQTNDAIRALGRDTGIRSCCVYGGVNINPQIQRLRDGVEIVVACPGRLLDHLRQKTIDLSGVEVLVVDEADRMFDMGFLPDVRRIMARLPARRQSLLFSATMPDDVRKLAGEILRQPVTVQVDLIRPAVTVAHALYPLREHLKTALLLELLRHTDTGSVIVFTRTKHRAKRVARQLEAGGHSVTCLQGNLSQNRRQAALDGFRNGDYKILVATDIASRGIDVTKITHVVNYDIPDTVDAYTHRIGRTGRLARTGDALTLVTGEDESMVRAIERVLGEKLDRRTLPGFDYNAPAPARKQQAPRQRQPQRVSEAPRHAPSRHTGRPRQGGSFAPAVDTAAR